MAIVRAVAEIIILFGTIYGILYYLRSSRGGLVFISVGLLWAILYFSAESFKLNVISHLLKLIGEALVVVLFVLFQPELRRALAQFGGFLFGQGRRRRREVIGEIVSAACNMAYRKCGALIVIERRIHLQTLVDDAVALDDKVNSLLLESIFFPNAPLHDGAVIIRDDRIVAARVILPLTRAKDISAQVGTRHRAALGISEECDAVIVVVSEETGAISIAMRGVLHRDLNGDSLRELLEKLLVDKDDEEFTETAKLLAEPVADTGEKHKPAGEEQA